MQITEIIELARQCSSRSEFAKKHSTEYVWLSRNHHMAVLDGVLPKNKGGRPREVRTLETVLSKAKSCRDRDEFHSRFKIDFQWLQAQSLSRHLDEVFGPDKRLQRDEITLDRVRERLKASPDRAYFQTYYKLDHAWLKQQGLLAELDAIHPLQRTIELSLESVRAKLAQCASRKEFVWNRRREYFWLREHSLLAELDARFPFKINISAAVAAKRATAWTDEELIKEAKKYKTRHNWKAGGPDSGYGAALKRGGEFMRRCCVHMKDERGGNRGFTYSDEELVESARKHETRNQWKKAARAHYHAALQRPIRDECVAHMRPAVNPFARDYVIYAEEFTDNHAYVGLTCDPATRKVTHACRGPVFDHAQMTGLTPTWKILQDSLLNTEVGRAEDTWQAKYATDGWITLHTAKAGSLGSIQQRGKWTRETVIADARRFKTKQEWIDNSQGSYRTAKANGWFDEASAHMPKRVLGVGAGIPKSAEASEKMRQAKLGRKLAQAHKDKIAASLKGNKRAVKARRVAEALLED